MDSINSLIKSFSKFPSIGPRQAAKFVSYLLKNKMLLDEFIKNFENLKIKATICNQCFMNFDKENNNLCPICSDKKRIQNQICVVEENEDIQVIEKTKIFNGLYHVLGGTINPIKKISSTDLTIEMLIKRIKNLQKENIKNIEIIIATNPTSEGELTRLYLEKELEPFNIKITHLGRGISTGSTLEYIDENTLINAFKNRV